MAKDTNTNNPRGFVYETRLGDQAPPVVKVAVVPGAIATIIAGMPLTITQANGGLAVAAVTGDVVFGVALGDPTPNEDGSAGYEVLCVVALPDVIFRVQDINILTLLESVGSSWDMIVQGVNRLMNTTISAVNGDVTVLALSAPDDFGFYNEVGEPYTDWNVMFNNTVWTGDAALGVIA